MNCRLCGNNVFAPQTGFERNIVDVIDLGVHANGSIFPSSKELKLTLSPLVLSKCLDCGLVQLKHTIDSSELYESGGYGYRSGINPMMTKHISDLVEEISETYLHLKDHNGHLRKTVLDIGCNDGTLLKCYNKFFKKVGIDPTITQFKSYYEDTDIYPIPDYFSKKVYDTLCLEKYGCPDVVTSLCMFYDLPDPLGFAKDISNLIKNNNGVWITEQSYIGAMLETFSFDTICHEHLEYYSFKQIEYIAKHADLKILNVSENKCNGGSFRITFAHILSKREPNYRSINKFLSRENDLKLEDLNTYTVFMEKCNSIKQNLVNFLRYQKKLNKKICLYGASTKGNTLLQYFGIDNNLIDCASERNPEKYGKFTPSTHIPIKSEEDVRREKPDFLLVLPWHFREGIIEREKEYLDTGGQFIFPLPHLEIVSSKKYKKVIITGVTGQLGSYLLDTMIGSKTLIYGTVHKTEKYREGVYYIPFDDLLTSVEMLMKDTNSECEIYNLAAVSDAQVSVKNPVLTMDINGNLPMKICDTILKVNKNIKFFNCCSSELFKGFGKKIITESNLTEMYPTTPYGIAKMAAYWSLRYYRETYGLFTVNGILFNTESKLRGCNFLTSKIAKKVREVRDCPEMTEHIEIGRLDMHRDWSHASDMVNAINLIMKLSVPGDFVLSSGKSRSVQELVETAFSVIDVKLVWKIDAKGNIGAYDSFTDEFYISVNTKGTRNYEGKTEMLIGDNSTLLGLRWVPKYSLYDIMKEMINAT
jgi:GDP-mannose 4,6-dehydratase